MTSLTFLFFLYYIKQVDSMLLCVSSVIDHRCLKMVRACVTLSYHLVCHLFLFLPHFELITEQTQNNMEALKKNSCFIIFLMFCGI